MKTGLALLSVVVVVSCATARPPVVAAKPTAQAIEQAKPVHLQAVRLHARQLLACDAVLLQTTGAGVLMDEDDNQRLSLAWVADGCGKRKAWVSTCPPLPGLGAAEAPPGKVVCRVQSPVEGEAGISDLGTDYVVDEVPASAPEPYDEE
jgi:hypothetical protein